MLDDLLMDIEDACERFELENHDKKAEAKKLILLLEEYLLLVN